MIEDAGAERLRLKAARLAGLIEEKGADQALYEELMAALGYKQNRLPFRHLARVVPLAALRAHRVLGGQPQSITQLSPEGIEWLRTEIGM